MSTSNAIGSPIPLSEIENVLAWVDTFKLSRPTKKINRDFSDAVLLAEMLSVHYPKLVEMHNYPPRNSHALKLNNWMTLNRKVLKKLRLNLCCDTMEQLANSTPGVVERVLVMVRDKIKKDEELEKANNEAEQNMSSGGSYYEACGDDEHVLVVPVKVRVNGVLETLQQKVVSFDAYTTQKNELKDANDALELLKQKVEHLDSLLKLKDERINELQKQLERKQARRKEVESLQNSINAPFEEVPPPVVETVISLFNKPSNPVIKVPSKPKLEEIKIPTPKLSSTKIPSAKVTPQASEASVTIIPSQAEVVEDVDRIKSDVFKEADLIEVKEKEPEGEEEFKDSEPGTIMTIEESIEREIVDIVNLVDTLEAGDQNVS